MEALAEVMKIGLDRPGFWPTLEEAQSYWFCVSCEWRGAQGKLIPREGHGRTGCPECGGQTLPLRALPGQSPESVLNTEPKKQVDADG